jgi:hypothetical protein
MTTQAKSHSARGPIHGHRLIRIQPYAPAAASAATTFWLWPQRSACLQARRSARLWAQRSPSL